MVLERSNHDPCQVVLRIFSLLIELLSLLAWFGPRCGSLPVPVAAEPVTPVATRREGCANNWQLSHNETSPLSPDGLSVLSSMMRFL